MQIRTRIKTTKPESEFEKSLDQELLSYTLQLAGLLNGGLKLSDNFNGELVTVADTGGANTENTLAHTLKRVPTGFLVLSNNLGGVVYTGATAWTTTQIFIKCTVANCTLLLFVL